MSVSTPARLASDAHPVTAAPPRWAKANLRHEDVEAVFLSSLQTVKELCRIQARRLCLSAVDLDDLYSSVCLHVISNDYRVLRQFEGRGSIRGYLAVIVRRVLLDRRTSELGKWRPSASAKRQGKQAVLIDRLTRRDGLSFDQACSVAGLPQSDAADARYYGAQTSHRPCCRRFVSLENIQDTPHPSATPFELLSASEARAVSQRAAVILRKAIASLNAEDRALLRLRYAQGISAADISRVLGFEQKGLYRRFDRVLAGLRVELESRGIRRQDLAAC